MPEGEVVAPAISAEYRRRRRRLSLTQILNLLGFVPLATWIGMEYLDDLGVRILYLTTVLAVFGILQHIAQRNFRCPVCGKTFPVIRLKPGAVSQRRLDMSYSRFRWCDNCGARFELYPPSARDPPKEDEGFGIL